MRSLNFHLLLFQSIVQTPPFLTLPPLPWLPSSSSEPKHRTFLLLHHRLLLLQLMDQVSMDVWRFEDDNNHSSSSSGSLPHNPFGGYWSSFSSLDDNYVVGISHDEVVDRVELGDTDILNSSAVQVQEQLNELNMLMDSMDSTCQVSGDIFQHSQIGSAHQSNLLYHSPFQILNEPSHFPSNKSCSFDSSSSNYMMTAQPMLPTSITNQHSFSLAAMEEMALTRAMVSVISSSSSTTSSSSSATTYQKAQTYQSQANYYPSMSSFQPYSFSKPPLMESHKNLHSQHMIKKAHNMLRNVNMLKDEEKVEETQPSAYQMQHMVSERRRRERLNASFHSLWQLLPLGSKKDKTSVLCKTVSYVKTLKDEIYELEGKNRIIEENLFTKAEIKEKSIKPNERVKVQISKSSETVSGEIQQIELVIMVRVQCDLIRVLLHVLECIKAMKAISLLSFDTVHNSQQLKLLATLKLAIQGSAWDEGTFKEAIAGAAHMALTMTA